MCLGHLWFVFYSNKEAWSESIGGASESKDQDDYDAIYEPSSEAGTANNQRDPGKVTVRLLDEKDHIIFQ